MPADFLEVVAEGPKIGPFNKRLTQINAKPLGDPADLYLCIYDQKPSGKKRETKKVLAPGRTLRTWYQQQGGNKLTMNDTLKSVIMCGSGSFLPNDPISNDRLEDVLGRLEDVPASIGSFVRNIGKRMPRFTGIESRHLAIDPKTREITHSTVNLAEPAARAALEQAGRTPQDVELLLVSSPLADYQTPPTSTMLQEALGIEHCAEMEIHSNCAGVGKMVQVAYDALRLGRYQNALIVYPQLSSVYLRAQYYNQDKVTRTQCALRHVLADGSGAVFLETTDEVDSSGGARQVLGTYIESVGASSTPGMTGGLGAVDLMGPGSPVPWLYSEGRHHLDQDFDAVNAKAVPLLVQGFTRMLESLKIDPGAVDHYVFSIPSKQLYEANLEKTAASVGFAPERAKFRARHTGYCGGASILLHLDEMSRSGELRQGDVVVLYSIESSKWMSGGFVVRW